LRLTRKSGMKISGKSRAGSSVPSVRKKRGDGSVERRPPLLFGSRLLEIQMQRHLNLAWGTDGVRDDAQAGRGGIQ